MGAKVDGGESGKLPIQPTLWGTGSGKDDNVIVVSGVVHGLSSDPWWCSQGYRAVCASLSFSTFLPIAGFHVTRFHDWFDASVRQMPRSESVDPV
ncbi:hypothetical protein NtRootA1_36460 [Arthrobacter sp. NtRootA1]|nr:hypothetical protein NtRootA1_36460 [Arthrobacter sp. NtRootA1]